MTDFSQDAIFGPMLLMMWLTMTVWFYMYSQRIPYIVGYLEKRPGLKPEDITAETLAKAPPSVRNSSDNLKNLFEMPILFYGMCCYLFVTSQVDLVYQCAAW
eukprot:CAMPEP_0197450668 /NCGR_PEP_ID=MMETSP1175-20131217/26086_1 /TAXON_ID=1003142 /ORGANISM="Triceratium dubium, Strain CCMP147" /LENGTH=101 /DNA_ID=CAMNT_0042983133 /DNA_START=167 /DNA_END=469 /DNA_ORIENTATION=+